MSNTASDTLTLSRYGTAPENIIMIKNASMGWAVSRRVLFSLIALSTGGVLAGSPMQAKEAGDSAKPAKTKSEGKKEKVKKDKDKAAAQDTKEKKDKKAKKKNKTSGKTLTVEAVQKLTPEEAVRELKRRTLCRMEGDDLSRTLQNAMHGEPLVVALCLKAAKVKGAPKLEVIGKGDDDEHLGYRFNDTACIKLLLDSGIMDSETKKKVFVHTFNAEVRKLLLKAGVDVNARVEYYGYWGFPDRSATALGLWLGDIHRRSLPQVRMLLEAGADPNGPRLLSEAKWAGCPVVAKLLLDAGADMKLKDAKGDTALVSAARYNRTVVVKHLLAMGTADAAEIKLALEAAKGNGSTACVAPLQSALDGSFKLSKNYAAAPARKANGKFSMSAEAAIDKLVEKWVIAEPEDLKEVYFSDDPEIMRLLLAAGYDAEEAVKRACDWNSCDAPLPLLVELALEAGADAAAVFEKEYSSYAKLKIGEAANSEILKVLLKAGADAKGQTAKNVLDDSLSINPDKAKVLLEAGTPADRESLNLALAEAWASGDRDYVALLCKSGAESSPVVLSNALGKVCSCRGRWLWKPADEIHASIRMLLKAGGDVNGRYKYDQGITALMYLSESPMEGLEDSIRLLLAKGADVNAKDEQGRTALMYAAGAGEEPGNAVYADILLEAGADAKARDNDGKSAQDYATEKKAAPELIRKLKAAEAK